MSLKKKWIKIACEKILGCEISVIETITCRQDRSCPFIVRHRTELSLAQALQSFRYRDL